MPAKRRLDPKRHTTVTALVRPQAKAAFHAACRRRKVTMSTYLAKLIDAVVLSDRLERGRRV